MQEDEDDTPPLLVGEDGLAPQPENEAADDGHAARVPITIITGIQSSASFTTGRPTLTTLDQAISGLARQP
jgi:hypothetical protein